MEDWGTSESVAQGGHTSKSVAKGGHVVWGPGGPRAWAQGGFGVVAWVAVAGCRVVRLWWPIGLWLQCERKTKQVCGPGWSHGTAGRSPAARVVMLCGLGGLGGGCFCGSRRGGLACGSGGPTCRGEVRVGRVSWGVGGPHPAADVAGAARGLRAVSKEREHAHQHAWRCVPRHEAKFVLEFRHEWSDKGCWKTVVCMWWALPEACNTLCVWCAAL